MEALQFAYWLQGFAELGGDEPPTPAQWKSIREHLGLVFKKVTPQLGGLPSWQDMEKSPTIGKPIWQLLGSDIAVQPDRETAVIC